MSVGIVLMALSKAWLHSYSYSTGSRCPDTLKLIHQIGKRCRRIIPEVWLFSDQRTVAAFGLAPRGVMQSTRCTKRITICAKRILLRCRPPYPRWYARLSR